MNSILTQATKAYSIRRTTFESKPHIIVPVVMMVEGVHSGSHGPLLHTAQELQSSVSQWDGTPVTITHPQMNGSFVSANTPGVQHVGKIFNTRMDGTKLKAEAWLDEQKLLSISPEASTYISQGRPVDVSIGVFTDEETIEGEWNGEAYIAVARNHRPDHLAILPGEQGACSWSDGCGIRTNKKGGETHQQNQLSNLNNNSNEMTDEIKDAKKQAVERVRLHVNRLSLSGRIDTLSRLVDGLDTHSENDVENSSYHYLEDVYEDYVIFKKRQKGVGEYYKQSYAVNADDSVSFVDSPIKVRKDVNYVQVNAEEPKPKRTIFSNNQNKEDHNMTKPSPCLLKKVDALINHSATQFEETDREFLLTQSENMLDKMLPKETQQEQPPQVNAEMVKTYIQESFKKPEDFVNLLPADMQDQLKSGLKLHKEQRTQLIEAITTNSQAFSKEELEAMDTTMLTKIASTAKAPVDYSLNGDSTKKEVQTNTSGSGGMLLPMGVEE